MKNVCSPLSNGAGHILVLKNKKTPAVLLLAMMGGCRSNYSSVRMAGHPLEFAQRWAH